MGNRRSIGWSMHGWKGSAPLDGCFTCPTHTITPSPTHCYTQHTIKLTPQIITHPAYLTFTPHTITPTPHTITPPHTPSHSTHHHTHPTHNHTHPTHHHTHPTHRHSLHSLRHCGDVEARRKILQHAVNSASDDPEGVCWALLEFEREVGTQESYEGAVERCAAQLRRVKGGRKRWSGRKRGWRVEQGRGEGGRGRPLLACSLMTVTKTGKLLLKGGNVAGQLLYTTL